MNLSEYAAMVEKVADDLKAEALAAAERNSHKDVESHNSRGHPSRWCKGWEGYPLEAKFLEEVAEVIRNPRDAGELGDLAWVLAMMLDQINAEKKKGEKEK